MAALTTTSGQGRSNGKSPVESQFIASFKFHVHRERRTCPFKPPATPNGPFQLRVKTLIHSFLTLLPSARHISGYFLSHRLFPRLRRFSRSQRRAVTGIHPFSRREGNSAARREKKRKASVDSFFSLRNAKKVNAIF